MFKANVGFIDRAFRIVVGLALLTLFFAYPDGAWRYAALIGIVPLLTGLGGACPLYALFGISSCPAEKG